MEVFSQFIQNILGKIFFVFIILTLFLTNPGNMFIRNFYSLSDVIFDVMKIMLIYIIFDFFINRLYVWLRKIMFTLGTNEKAFFNKDFVEFKESSRFDWKNLTNENEAIILNFYKKNIVEINFDELNYRYTPRAVYRDYSSSDGVIKKYK